MSEKNREGKRTARERLAAERKKQRTAEKRRRGLIVGGAVVGVLALAAAGGVLAASAGKDDGASAGPVVTPSGAQGKDALAIPVGEDGARSTLTVWEDFRCPVCKTFEDAYRSTLHELTDSGQLKIEYHFATIIDGNMRGSGSLRATNAAACAQDAGKFPEYHDVLYQNQPQEADDRFADNGRLLDLAEKVDGLRTDAFEKCVEDGTHDSWVAKSAAAFRESGHQGTPTVLLNGKQLFEDGTLTPDKFKRMVVEANKA